MSKLLTVTFSGLSKSDRQNQYQWTKYSIHITLSFNFKQFLLYHEF